LVPPDTGLRQCADVLRNDGSVALWWNVYGEPSRHDPFHESLTRILERLAPSLPDVPGAAKPRMTAPPNALDVTAGVAEIGASDRFGPVHHEVISWTGRHRPIELRALFASYSPWLALPAERRTTVLDALERLPAEEFGESWSAPT
jgi:hypothetical protein